MLSLLNTNNTKNNFNHLTYHYIVGNVKSFVSPGRISFHVQVQSRPEIFCVSDFLRMVTTVNTPHV